MRDCANTVEIRLHLRCGRNNDDALDSADLLAYVRATDHADVVMCVGAARW